MNMDGFWSHIPMVSTTTDQLSVGNQLYVGFCLCTRGPNWAWVHRIASHMIPLIAFSKCLFLRSQSHLTVGSFSNPLLRLHPYPCGWDRVHMAASKSRFSDICTVPYKPISGPRRSWCDGVVCVHVSCEWIGKYSVLRVNNPGHWYLCIVNLHTLQDVSFSPSNDYFWQAQLYFSDVILFIDFINLLLVLYSY